MDKIPAQSGPVNFSFQTNPTQETRSRSVFSRGADSGNNLFSSLKSLFSRTDKSQAKAVVARTVPSAVLEPVKAGTGKRVHFEFDSRTRVRMAYRNFLDPSGTGQTPKPKGQGYEEKVSHFDSAMYKVLNGVQLHEGDKKIINQELPHLREFIENNAVISVSEKTTLLKDFSEIWKKAVQTNPHQPSMPVGQQSEQLIFEKSFVNDFKVALRSALDNMVDTDNQRGNTGTFIGVIVDIAGTELIRQMKDESKIMKKEDVEKNIQSRLNSTFNNDIPIAMMTNILDAISMSFDFADAEELRKMQSGEFG